MDSAQTFCSGLENVFLGIEVKSAPSLSEPAAKRHKTDGDNAGEDGMLCDCVIGASVRECLRQQA